MIDKKKHELLKKLPSVDKVVRNIISKSLFPNVPKKLIVSCIRSSIQQFRSIILEKKNILKYDFSIENILEDINYKINKIIAPKLQRVINATGVVVHTNLGRSLLSDEAIENLTLISSNYSNLEFDIGRGSRGNRHNIVESILCEISGAEAAIVVNNNAAAVLICLNTMANSKEVIISRGELVEIGDSFRIPDVMLKSGSKIKEVGTTNRTHIEDYTDAITDKTALLMKVHTSNYAIVGFTTSVSLSELIDLGQLNSLPVIEDIGSGSFIDFSKYGFKKEPTVQQSIACGIDIVTFSGDKLLGGPQAGIILGKKKYINRIKKNPLARALRVDKITLSALEATLKLYFDEKEAIKKIPTLKMLFQSVDDIEKKVLILFKRIKSVLYSHDIKTKVKIFDMPSLAGGGALPISNFPSKCLGVIIDNLSVNSIEKFMRGHSVPIIGRIENGYYILDPRTISSYEINIIEEAFKKLIDANF